MAPYTIVSRTCKFTHVVKKQLESRQKKLGKTAAVKAEAYIVSMDRKTTLYELEAGKSAYKLSIATRSRVSRDCRA